MAGGEITFSYVERDIRRRWSLQVMRAIQERLTFGGPTARYRPHADGFGVVTSTRECGPSDRALPEGSQYA
jgi:hypothetical protein